MTSPLINRLVEQGHASPVDEAGLDSLVQQHNHTLLFFAGDAKRYPESNDLAVILPELAKAFTGEFQIGLVQLSAEPALQKRYGFTHWPTLVMLRGGDYLGSISKLQDWAGYCAEIRSLLQSEPRRAPGFAIPVIDQRKDTCS